MVSESDVPTKTPLHFAEQQVRDILRHATLAVQRPDQVNPEQLQITQRDAWLSWRERREKFERPVHPHRLVAPLEFGRPGTGSKGDVGTERDALQRGDGFDGLQFDRGTHVIRNRDFGNNYPG